MNTKQNSEQAIKKALERRLDPPLSSDEWEDLIYEGRIDDGEEAAVTISDALDLVRHRRRIYGRRGANDHVGSSLRRAHRESAPLPIADAVTRDPRVQALSQAVARYAERDKFVQKFRDEVLPDGPLTATAAKRWVGRQRRLGKRRDTRSAAERRKVRFFGDGSPALSRLESLSHDLADIYCWEYVDAERFVLTGHPPPIFPLWASTVARPRFPALSRLILTVDPALPPHELAASYRKLRRIWIRTPKRRTRRISGKHAKLAVFALRRPEAETWNKTLTRWNAKCAATERYQHLSNFRRDCGRAIKRLLGNPVSTTLRQSSRPSR